MTEHSGSALSERLFGQAVVATEAASVWLGQKLGWYAGLRTHGPATPEELAVATGSQPRYAQEWLEQQAVAGIITRDQDGRFSLPPGHAEALLDQESPLWTEPLVRQMVTAILQLPAIAEAYRTGGGVGWEAYGPEMSLAQADVNRSPLRHALPNEWVPQIPELRDRLSRPARVADVGCGHGWSAIGLAAAFPGVEVDGFDVDPVGLRAAREHAAAAGVADRVRFHQVDAGTGLTGGPYDVLLAVECVHDLPHPVEVLAAIRQAAKPDAVVIVVDEAADPVLATPGDEVQRLLYGFSLLICLPDSMSHPRSAAVGAVIRPDTLAGFATAAGFAGAEPLEVTGTGFWNVYRLPIPA
jgi:2-polyprenyl-3-methyl-5-hydroxy-6-metoxy-1,4-benzoquinol methylase